LEILALLVLWKIADRLAEPAIYLWGVAVYHVFVPEASVTAFCFRQQESPYRVCREEAARTRLA
jgi:hypothetical protein